MGKETIMSVHLRREIDKLNRDLSSLCELAESQVEQAVRALENRDVELARQVAQRDAEVDRREVDLEEECLRMLALYQPVAIDLRLIVSALKINNDLERVGDLAVNIARKAIGLIDEPPGTLPPDLTDMAAKTQTMLRDSLRALVRLDAKLAAGVCARDDEVDQLKRRLRAEAEKAIQADPRLTRPLMRILAVARNLERIADYATNIAEDVVYMVEGRIVRHGEGE
jgi:phosphate transport system protein